MEAGRISIILKAVEIFWLFNNYFGGVEIRAHFKHRRMTCRAVPSVLKFPRLLPKTPGDANHQAESGQLKNSEAPIYLEFESGSLRRSRQELSSCHLHLAGGKERSDGG